MLPILIYSNIVVKIIHMEQNKGGSMMEQVMNVAVVNFHSKWGDKAYNLERITGYMKSASKRGVDLIIFPEMCLTGYDDDTHVMKEEKMQVKNAESKYGPLAGELAILAKKYELYFVLGMPEKDVKDTNAIYNSALIGTPNSELYTYRKIHLALDEPNWANAGAEPCLIDSPWGPIGICMCYDVYSFPELIRYYAAKGARLIVNATAYAKSRGYVKGKTTLESSVLMNGVYIATANLCGKDLKNEFWGGSSIIGPSRKMQEVCYYAGGPFGDESVEEQEMYMATIDLSLASRNVYEENPLLNRPDFRPDLYAKLYNELATKS